MKISLIAAMDRGFAIGKDGALPWQLPDDLKRFKALTMGKAMIMGRKTFDSFPAPLPGRRHIVLTRDPDWAEEGAEVAHSADEALKLANGPHVCIIGGVEIYRLFLPRADRVELTEIRAKPPGDTRLEAFDPKIWQEISRDSHPADASMPAFDFVTLVRREG